MFNPHKTDNSQKKKKQYKIMRLSFAKLNPLQVKQTLKFDKRYVPSDTS